MSINDLIPYLRLLDMQPSWRRSELPQEMTPHVLNELDRYELIELQRWSLSDQDNKTPVPNWRGWFVVRNHTSWFGTLDEILADRECQGEFEPEFRVSPKGAEWLLRAETLRGRESDGAPTLGKGQQRPDAGDDTSVPNRPADKAFQAWQPPNGYVGRKTVCSDERFRKHGKHPPATTIDAWVNAVKGNDWTVTQVHRSTESYPEDPCDRLGQNELVIFHAPDSGECFYPERWITARIATWNPRNPKT